MDVGIISLFPEMFKALDYGIVGRAQQQNLLRLRYWNPRAYTLDKHRNVDDRPYGGGPGMVMAVQPLRDSLLAAKNEIGVTAKVVLASPQGKVLKQSSAEVLKSYQKVIFIAGRYEGIDERFINSYVDEEWSIGDYVLSGGELAIMVMIDTITRLLPGALGDADSAQQDSFQTGLLDCPHYTRPEVVDEQQVPEVLLSGNHTAIQRWRQKQALGSTWLKRPDLLTKLVLTNEQQELLNEFIQEHGRGTKQ